MTWDYVTAGDHLRLKEMKAELISVMHKGDADSADKAEENIREFLGANGVSQEEINTDLIEVRKQGLEKPRGPLGGMFIA